MSAFFSLSVGVINIPVKVGQEAWEECFREAAGRSFIFGVNETLSPGQKVAYQRWAKKLGLGFAGLGKSPNPVFWDKAHWRRVESAVHRLHTRGTDTLARRFPGFNDARYATEVVLAAREGNPSPEVAVICTHWVPEGRKVSALWRAHVRAEAKRAVRRIAKRHLREGRVVYIIGDTNIYGIFKFAIRGYQFQWVEGERIDKIGVWTPKGIFLKQNKARIYRAPTDHGHGIASEATFFNKEF